MNADALIQFMLNLPFEPFILFLADGRTFTVQHPEMASVQRFGLSMRVRHDDDRIELIDAALIVSIMTENPSEGAFLEEPEEDTE